MFPNIKILPSSILEFGRLGYFCFDLFVLVFCCLGFLEGYFCVCFFVCFGGVLVLFGAFCLFFVFVLLLFCCDF